MDEFETFFLGSISIKAWERFHLAKNAVFFFSNRRVLREVALELTIFTDEIPVRILSLLGHFSRKAQGR